MWINPIFFKRKACSLPIIEVGSSRGRRRSARWSRRWTKGIFGGRFSTFSHLTEVVVVDVRHAAAGGHDRVGGGFRVLMVIVAISRKLGFFQGVGRGHGWFELHSKFEFDVSTCVNRFVSIFHQGLDCLSYTKGKLSCSRYILARVHLYSVCLSIVVQKAGDPAAAAHDAGAGATTSESKVK